MKNYQIALRAYLRASAKIVMLFKISTVKFLMFLCSVFFVSLPAYAISNIEKCREMMLAIGAGISLTDVIDEATAKKRFLEALVETNASRGFGEPIMLSNPDGLHAVAAAHGGLIIGTSTFSRELSDAEYSVVYAHSMGLLSAFANGQAVIASGGTAGEWDLPHATGGGVGLLQNLAKERNFPVISILASAGYKYRPAPADIVVESSGPFSAESINLYKFSKALVVYGGGKQAYLEAISYLTYNPKGFLVLIDDPKLGGSSVRLAANSEFQNLAKNDDAEFKNEVHGA